MSALTDEPSNERTQMFLKKKNAPIIDVPEITKTVNVVPVDSSEKNVTAVIIGLRDRW